MSVSEQSVEDFKQVAVSLFERKKKRQHTKSDYELITNEQYPVPSVSRLSSYILFTLEFSDEGGSRVGISFGSRSFIYEVDNVSFLELSYEAVKDISLDLQVHIDRGITNKKKFRYLRIDSMALSSIVDCYTFDNAGLTSAMLGFAAAYWKKR